MQRQLLSDCCFCMQSLEQVFEVKERKAEVKAQREAERLAQQRAAKKAERLQQREAERVRQQEAEGLCQREAERQADEQGIRTSKPFRKACASGMQASCEYMCLVCLDTVCLSVAVQQQWCNAAVYQNLCLSLN